MAAATATDPLGRTLSLHDRTWYGHIIKGHPEVAPHRDMVLAALAHPDSIRFSTSDSQCRKYVGEGPRPGLRMIVVADVARGLVKTAYLSRSPKGNREWP